MDLQWEWLEQGDPRGSIVTKVKYVRRGKVELPMCRGEAAGLKLDGCQDQSKILSPLGAGQRSL